MRREPKELFITPNKHVLLFFTGGLDSTYLLWKNLELGNTVTPVYVEIENNKNKTQIELQQTKFIWSLLKDDHGDKLKPIEFDHKIRVNGAGAVAMPQVPLWVTFALYAQNDQHDEVHVGYVQDDAATGSYLKDIEKMYYSFLPVTHGLAKLVFPLRKKAKYHMIHELPEELFNAIITCEDPVIKPYKISNAFKYGEWKEDQEYRFWKPCGYCEMCKKIKANNYYNTRKPYVTDIDKDFSSDLGGIMLAPDREVADFSDLDLKA